MKNGTPSPIKTSKALKSIKCDAVDRLRKDFDKSGIPSSEDLNLMLAESAKHLAPRCMELLLGFGADPNQRAPRDGQTLIHTLVRYMNRFKWDGLFDTPPGGVKREDISEERVLECTTILVEAGARCSDMDDLGNNPAHYLHEIFKSPLLNKFLMMPEMIESLSVRNKNGDLPEDSMRLLEGLNRSPTTISDLMGALRRANEERADLERFTEETSIQRRVKI